MQAHYCFYIHRFAFQCAETVIKYILFARNLHWFALFFSTSLGLYWDAILKVNVIDTSCIYYFYYYTQNYAPAACTLRLLTLSCILYTTNMYHFYSNQYFYLHHNISSIADN